MVINYNNSKIHEYINSDNNEPVFIGSTTRKCLSQRMSAHRAEYKLFNKNENKSFNSSYLMFDKFGIDNCQKKLLENVNATTSDELKAHEIRYIKLLNCVNYKTTSKY